MRGLNDPRDSAPRRRRAQAAVDIEVAIPDVAPWSAGNTGIAYAWRFEGPADGPRVTVQALTHGNEVCGAIALDWLLRTGFRPSRGTLTLVFANIAAYEGFDPSDPFASRCLDEDFNRLWSEDTLDGPRHSRELQRARELRPLYDATDYLLDLHSMTDAAPALALAGPHPKGVALARAIGMPQLIVSDTGHAAGKRLRDYAFFDDPDDPRSALLLECGQHWESASPVIAQQAMLRFLAHFGLVEPEFAREHVDSAPLPPQVAIQVTEAITIRSERFGFVLPVHNLQSVAQGGTLIARDGDREIRTPHDNCVLIMPTRRPRPGETAVRLGRVLA